MRIVKVFWGLDASLAYARHFPAINWLTSYTLYQDTLKPWYDKNFGPSFLKNCERMMSLLQSEAELQEIVKLVGQDALSQADRLTLETSKMLREDFLQQNAFVDLDSYTSYGKQMDLLALILKYNDLCKDAIDNGTNIDQLTDIPSRERIGRAKMIPPEEYKAAYESIAKDMAREIAEISGGGDEE